MKSFKQCLHKRRYCHKPNTYTHHNITHMFWQRTNLFIWFHIQTNKYMVPDAFYVCLNICIHTYAFTFFLCASMYTYIMIVFVLLSKIDRTSPSTKIYQKDLILVTFLRSWYTVCHLAIHHIAENILIDHSMSMFVYRCNYLLWLFCCKCEFFLKLCMKLKI